MQINVVRGSFLLLLLIVFSTFNLSNSGGAADRICASCHTGNIDDINGDIYITNPPLDYNFDERYPMTLCVEDSEKAAAGFRLEASIGTLEVGEGETRAQIIADEATHNQRNPIVDNVACWNIDWIAPSTGTENLLLTFRANAVNNNFAATGDNGGYFITYGSIILPVQYSDMNIDEYNGTVELNWITEQEINNDRFIIERSTDLETWTTTGEVNGSGNSSEQVHYNFKEYLPITGTIFYRITQVDYDGTIHISDHLSVTIDDNNRTQNLFLLGESITIDTPGNIYLYSLSGARLDHCTACTTIQLDDLKPGLYILTVNEQSRKIWVTE